MGFLWTAKGDLSSNIITWMIAIVIAIIVMVWFVKNNPFGISKQIGLMNEDLMKISEHIDRACIKDEYMAKYNPLIESGMAEFSAGDVCIVVNQSSRTLRRCEPLSCNVTQANLNLAKLTYIIIDKKELISIGME